MNFFRIVRLLAITALFTLVSSLAYAKSYYVCDTGDDSNHGRTPEAPFKTYQKAIDTFNTMFGGESVLFCRGGVFPATVNHKWLYNTKCGPELRCTLADYGDPQLARPKIVARNINAALDFMNGGNAVPDGGYIVKNLILESDGTAKFGVNFYNDVDDVLLKNLHIEGFQAAIVSGEAKPGAAGGNLINERIKLVKSVITNNFSQGWLGGCSDCLIQANQFSNNGFKHAIYGHNIYLGGAIDNPSTGVTVKNNTLYQSGVFEGKCQGTSLVVHGVVNDLRIIGNTIKEDVGAVNGYCWGISVDPGYESEEVFRNVIIKNNKLMNVGGVAIGCASCVKAKIIGNTIIDQAKVLTSGIKVPVRNEDTEKSRDISIKNNIVYTNNPSAYAVSVGGEFPFVVKNNILGLSEQSSHEKCIEKLGANVDINTRSNACNFYSGLPSYLAEQ